MSQDVRVFGISSGAPAPLYLADQFGNAIATAAGNTGVLSVTIGKLLRLMGYTISVAGTLAAAGVQQIQLVDAASSAILATHFATVDTTATGDTQIGADLGNGILLTGYLLYVNLGTAMATGGVAVNAWGTVD